MLAVPAAQAIATLEETDPRLVAGLPPAERRNARAIASYADLGLPPDRAVALAEQDAEIAEAEDAEREEIAQQPQPPVPDPLGEEVVDNDQSDVPFLGPDEGVGNPEEEEPQLTDEDVDELLRRDGLAPIPRGDVPVEEESARQVAPLTSFVASQHNERLAAKQFTSPDTSRYERLGRYEEWAMGPAYRDESGDVVPISPRRHILLIDPESGELTVYRRTEETDESRLLSFSRLLSATLFTNAVTAGARAAQIATKGKSGASTALSSGIGPTGSGRSRRGGRGGRRRTKTRKKAPALRDLPEGPGFKADRKFLTADEFRDLPDRGRIDPQRVRTSQSSIREKFQAKRDASGKKRQPTVGEMARGLISGDKKPEKIRAIRIVELNGHVYTLDHRRLVAFRRAGIDIPYRKVEFDKLPTDLKDRVSNASNLNDNGAFVPNRTLKVKE